MGGEGRDAHQRIVPPIGSAIPAPPGGAERVAAHAVAHAELEQAGKGALRRQAHDQALKNAEPRMGLHDPHHGEDGGCAHQAVRIQRQHGLEMGAMGPAEVPHIAGLEALIVAAAPVVQPDPAFHRAPGGHGCLFRLGNVRQAGVGENEIFERTAVGAVVQLSLDRTQT